MQRTVKSKQDLTSEVYQTQCCCCQVSRCGRCSSHEQGIWVRHPLSCVPPAHLTHRSEWNGKGLERGFFLLKVKLKTEICPNLHQHRWRGLGAHVGNPKGSAAPDLGLLGPSCSHYFARQFPLWGRDTRVGVGGQIWGSPRSKKCQTVETNSLQCGHTLQTEISEDDLVQKAHGEQGEPFLIGQLLCGSVFPGQVLSQSWALCSSLKCRWTICEFFSYNDAVSTQINCSILNRLPVSLTHVH